ncbi:MAG: hypothetical protein O7C75_06840, partial [Verrucomicrobia bacterium]|nr:hypothetical protein [Verrucomicrobiota bacterium]
MKNPSKSNLSNLKKRLAELDPEQRKQLLEKISAGKSKTENPVQSASIPKANPIRIESILSDLIGEVEIKVYPASHTQERMWCLHEFVDHKPGDS